MAHRNPSYTRDRRVLYLVLLSLLTVALRLYSIPAEGKDAILKVLLRWEGADDLLVVIGNAYRKDSKD